MQSIVIEGSITEAAAKPIVQQTFHPNLQPQKTPAHVIFFFEYLKVFPVMV